jgi:hypothetical protein
MVACNQKDGYACFGGTEIWNECRTLTYLDALFPQDGFTLTINKDDEGTFCCGCCVEAYSTPATDMPPWYDATKSESAGFYGIIPTEIVGLTGNPTGRSVSSGFAGGVLNRRSETARTIEVTALAFGNSCESVEYGLAWLNATLERDCGADGFTWQSCCPASDSPASGSPASGETLIDTGRSISCVALTEGIDAERYEPDVLQGYVYEVTFVLTAERSWIYDAPVVLANQEMWPGGASGELCVEYTADCIDGAVLDVFVDRKGNDADQDITLYAANAKYMPPLPGGTLTLANSTHGGTVSARRGDSIFFDPRCLGVWLVGPTDSLRRPASNVTLNDNSQGLHAVASYGETWRVCVSIPDNNSGPVSATIRAWPRRRI